MPQSADLAIRFELWMARFASGGGWRASLRGDRQIANESQPTASKNRALTDSAAPQRRKAGR